MGSWDTIVIGKGDRRNSAIRVFGITGDDHNVAENANCYWISSVFDSKIGRAHV